MRALGAPMMAQIFISLAAVNACYPYRQQGSYGLHFCEVRDHYDHRDHSDHHSRNIGKKNTAGGYRMIEVLL